MKKFLAICCIAFASMSSRADAQLLITEVVDGNRIAADGSAGSGSDPFLAFVEITNAGMATADLSLFGIQNFNNGNTTTGFGSAALSGTLDPGETYYISYEGTPDEPGEFSAFETVYGFAPNQFSGGKFFNGDDVLVLFDTPYVADDPVDLATVVDVYGVLGTDGTGEVWEYTDTQVSRNVSATSGTSTFDPLEWTFGATNDFDGEGAAFHAANTSVIPPASTSIPEPGSAFALAALAGVGVLRRRR